MKQINFVELSEQKPSSDRLRT